MNRLFFIIFIVTGFNLMAADNTCVTCNQKNVAGLPSVSGLNQIEKVVTKTQALPTVPLGKFYDYCGDFESATNNNNVGTLLDRFVIDGYSPEEILMRCECKPRVLNRLKYKIPMVQLLAEDINGTIFFPKDIYEHFYRKNKLESWLKVINAENTKGMTLLDYIKYNFDKDKDTCSEGMKQNYRNTYKYICDRDGAMSFYKDEDCKKGL